LANLGLGQRGAVLVLYGLGLATGCVALLLTQISTRLSVISGAVVALAALAAVAALERAPFERQSR
jgi:hypothetical protein